MAVTIENSRTATIKPGGILPALRGGRGGGREGGREGGRVRKTKRPPRGREGGREGGDVPEPREVGLLLVLLLGL